jgi:hypothetical protein
LSQVQVVVGNGLVVVEAQEAYAQQLLQLVVVAH